MPKRPNWHRTEVEERGGKWNVKIAYIKTYSELPKLRTVNNSANQKRK